MGAEIECAQCTHTHIKLSDCKHSTVVRLTVADLCATFAQLGSPGSAPAGSCRVGSAVFQ
eukprot:919549-Alexandrium_andersonii.AAC.1